MLDPAMTQMLVNLGEVGTKNTAAAIQTRIRTARAADKADETMAEMQTIINELVQERTDLQLMANGLRDYVLAQQISTDEISYITGTLIPLLEKLFRSGADDVEPEQAQQGIEIAKQVLTPEVLHILQLLGFSYKRAIGEPLTQVVHSLIARAMPNPSAEAAQNTMAVLIAEQNLELMRIVQDPEAWARWRAATGQEVTDETPNQKL